MDRSEFVCRNVKVLPLLFVCLMVSVHGQSSLNENSTQPTTPTAPSLSTTENAETTSVDTYRTVSPESTPISTPTYTTTPTTPSFTRSETTEKIFSQTTSTVTTVTTPSLRSQAENLTLTPGPQWVYISFYEPENETNQLFKLNITQTTGNIFTRRIVLCRNVTSFGTQCQNWTSDINGNHITHNVTGLLPHTRYSVTVVMIKCNESNATQIESGPAVKYVKTLDAVPGEVRNISTRWNSSHVCVTWEPPEINPGPLSYKYTFKDLINDGSSPNRNTSDEKICRPKTDLIGFWEYSVGIVAKTSAGESAEVESEKFITNTRVPNLQVDVRDADGNSCSNTKSRKKHGNYRQLIMNWADPRPEDRGMRLTSYVVTVQNGPYNNNFTKNTSFTNLDDKDYRRTPSKPYTYPVEVVPGSTYNITMQLFNNNTTVVWTKTFRCTAPIGAPPDWKGPPPSLKVAETKTLTIIFPDADFFTNNANGIITQKYIIVRRGDKNRLQSPCQKGAILDLLQWQRKRVEYWIDLKSENNFGEYTLGTEGDCDGFCNGALRPNSFYIIRGFVCTKRACKCSPVSEPLWTKEDVDNAAMVAVALVSVAVFVGVVVVIAALLWKFKQSDNITIQLPLSIKRGVDISKIPRERPMVLADIDAKVAEMHADSNRLFSVHYEDIVRISPRLPTDAANLDENKQKNRWVNVLPFDVSRVTMSVLDGEETTDYINASYMPGYNWDKEYIASQGPLPSTVDDFWRMIWEQKVSIIVMVTPLKENGKVKCEEYWPVDVSEPKQYGNIVVENTSFSSLNTYNVTIFKLRIGETEEFRTVKHFHFLNWKDMSADVERNDIMNFVRTVRSYVRPDMEGPIVVHCSAGVGRTGTFICLDYLTQFIENHDLHATVDIYAFILKLREHRVLMVQTESQYIFIHDCVRQLVEEKREALDNLSDDELLYVNTEVVAAQTDEEERCLIYENAETANSTARLVQQTEL